MRKIAIIPARAGSKSITKKNLLLFRGKPLFYWSLKVAIEADIFDKIYLSTDCDEIIRYSRNLSIDIIKRPSEICKDRSRDIEYLKNLINHIDFEDYTISILRPTSPLRKKEVIQECNVVFEENIEHYDSLRVVAKSKENPYKMWHITKEKYPKLIPLLNPQNIHEPYNAPRQELPETYWQTGYLDIVKPCNIKKNSMLGHRIFPFLKNDDCLDIDNLEDIK